jgi:DNA-binding SARP family transcriptional activator/tetratricopeptide (TPR) repeat protein
MEYLILGPLEVRDGERAVTVRQKKSRALLALLLLRAGEVVSTDALIEEIWATPPRTARQALHNCVAQLRRELGDHVIERRDAAYLLRIDPSQLDLARFKRLVTEARETESPEQRALQLREALALWRGPPLGDLVYEPFARAEIPRLEELHRVTRQDLIDAQLELGRHADVVGELESLVEEHPFDERLRGQLMLALYRSGRQADALAVYRDARRALVDNLGLEPGAALRELEQAILRQDPSLDLPAVLPSLEERRKSVTVLSCEVVPATSGLDPEEVRRLTAKALSTVRAAIDANGGTVETRGGEELLGVFGVPAAHEDDALRAVRAASEFREELADVEVRIGIDTGEVLAGHGFVSGEVVSRGKRLQREAAAGDILLGAATLALCRNAVKVRSTKGAVRLLEVEKGARPIARGLDAPLVGRKRELAALGRAYEEACEARRPRLIAVVGEPGIGKTRLVRELVRGVSDEATVLVGRCVSYGQGATFLPLIEMVAQAGESLEETTGNAGSVGEQLLAVRRFFERRAGERPLVLVFDDVHWAEPTLLDLVEQLGTHAEGPILTLCLARPELREQRPGLAEGAIELGPLGERQVHALVDSLAEDVPEEVRARVVENAGGNPLFAEQLVAYAQEGGAVDAVPPSAEALIAARLDLLDPTELAVLQRAAVVGRLFSRSAVEDLSPPSELAAIGDCLLGLAEKNLVRRRRDGLRFHHVLVRDVAYGSLPKAERAVLHERLADWLDERDAADELVGYHLEQAHRQRAELGRLDGRARRLAADAGGRLGAAGIEAWKRGDAPAAVNLLGRATGLLPERGSFRLELCCELGLALLTAGELRRANETLAAAAEAAVDAGDRRLELRARLELAYLRLFTDEGRTDELIDAATQALPIFDGVEDDRSLGRAWLTLSFVHGLMHCRHAAATEAAERAMDCHHRSGWPVSACLAYLSAAAQNGVMPAQEAIRRCRQLLAQADLGGEANVLPSLAELEAMRGHLAEARQLVARARTIYDQLGQQALAETNCAPIEGRIELLAGDADASERALRASYEALERMGGVSYVATRAAELGDALCGLGRYDEAERLSLRAEALGATDDVLTQLLWRSLRARVLARHGRLVEAEMLIGEAARLAEETDALNLRAKVLLDRAEVLQLAGRSNEAGEAVEQAIQLFELKGNVVAANHARVLLLELAPV